MKVAERLSGAATRLGLVVLLAAGVVAGLGLPGAGAAATGAGHAAQPVWAVQPTPQIPDPSGDFGGVSCATSTFCAAVGKPDYGGALAAAWNGTNWRRQSLSGISPHGVSCVSPAFCVAVGGGRAGATIATWNGTAWAAQKAPQFGGALLGVSCAATSACLAVGENTNAIGNQFIAAQWWNGTQWQRVTLPHLGGDLYAVSCTSATACTAVGFYNKSRKYNLLIERWNGTSMTLQQPAQGPTADFSTLAGVSCPQADGCVAVGYAGSLGFKPLTPLAESWNGTAWTAMNSPSLLGKLDSVSCTAVTACSAVGQMLTSNTEPLLAEQLTGTTWSVQQIPTPAGPGGILTGVSCVQVTDCTAVGIYTSHAQDFRSLAEGWNGTAWTIQATPNNQRPALGSLSDVSCPEPTQCTAVGGYTSSDNNHDPVSETWNGTRWALRGSPSPSTAPTVPSGISCPTTTMCMTVGSYTGFGARTYPWAALWNGTTWATVNPPRPSGQSMGGELSEVSCASATSCIAVGATEAASQNPLTYAWNGSKWTRLRISVLNGEILTGVSCTSTVSCVAVGTGGTTWLAEAWNGQTWKQMPISAGSGSPSINSVSCSSATACTAVGIAFGLATSAIERWDGTSWTAQQPAPPPSGATIPSLNGVSCASATACTAVGYYSNGPGGNDIKVFVQSWDGTSWTAVPAPPAGPGALASVVCSTPSVCIAVGEQKQGSVHDGPLAESSG